MPFTNREIVEQYHQDMCSVSLCSSRPQPANLEQTERAQYQQELSQNPGIRQPARSGVRKTPRR